MYSNPLIKKHANGGSTTSQEEQAMAEFFEWLTTSVQDFQGMDIEQVAQAIQGMTKTPEGKKQVEVLLKQFAASKQSQTGMFKQGGKLHDFICKHATGGRVKAGCGCHEDGGEIEKADDGTKLYDKNGVALNNKQFDALLPGEYGFAVVPTKLGQVVTRLNDMDRAMIWPGNYTRPIHQKMTSFEIVDNADYPKGFPIWPANRELNYNEARNNIIERNPQEKPWNGVELPLEKCGGKVKKGEDGMVSEKKTPDIGKITQGKSRSKLSQAIDNNPKARHLYEGVVKFTESPMVRWPIAGVMANLGWKLGGLSELGKFGNMAGAYLSQMNPAFVVKSVFHPESTKNAKVSDLVYALPK